MSACRRGLRKGDVQEPMRERPGSAVGFAGGLDFRMESGSGGPHRLDEGLHPEDGDHPLQIVRENVEAHLRDPHRICLQPRDRRGTRGAKRLAFGPRPRQSASSRTPTQSIKILTQPTFSHMG